MSAEAVSDSQSEQLAQTADDGVSVTTIGPDFALDVASRAGGEQILRCFACGTCTAGCPVAEVDERYNPRRIIRMVLVGMRDAVLHSDVIWLCAGCYTCQERCPQGVHVAEIMRTLRNMAVEAGIVHPAFKMQAELIRQMGRIYEIEDFDNKKRTRAGLPELRKVLEDVRTLFEGQKINERLD
jgi:heterodisulfide reductase subunit C